MRSVSPLVTATVLQNPSVRVRDRNTAIAHGLVDLGQPLLAGESHDEDARRAGFARVAKIGYKLRNRNDEAERILLMYSAPRPSSGSTELLGDPGRRGRSTARRRRRVVICQTGALR